MMSWSEWQAKPPSLQPLSFWAITSLWKTVLLPCEGFIVCTRKPVHLRRSQPSDRLTPSIGVSAQLKTLHLASLAQTVWQLVQVGQKKKQKSRFQGVELNDAVSSITCRPVSPHHLLPTTTTRRRGYLAWGQETAVESVGGVGSICRFAACRPHNPSVSSMHYLPVLPPNEAWRCKQGASACFQKQAAGRLMSARSLLLPNGVKDMV